MRYKLLPVLCLCSGLAQAEWTGVELTLGNSDSDWRFGSGEREARISQISFQIEEKSNTELRIGASLGHMNLRVAADTPAESRSFDAQYISIFLRQPIRVSESVYLHGLLNFRYATGHDGDDVDPADIDWSEVGLELGVSMRFSQFRIMPFVGYYDLDGDISDDNGTDVFEYDDPQSRGVRFDFFVEDSAFVRFEIQAGHRNGVFLTFARQY